MGCGFKPALSARARPHANGTDAFRPGTRPLASLPWTGGGSDWPQFRGPHGNGVAPAAALPATWSESEHVAWKVALPGSGWSQPVVVGELVFVTTAVSEALPRPLSGAPGAPDPRKQKPPEQAPDVSIDWQVLALELGTGKLRWQRSACAGKPPHPIHPVNTYATETPCADANGVYAFFGATGTLAAFDRAGTLLWKAELGAHPTAHRYGTGSSPAIRAGKLFVQSFSEDLAFLACLDARSGQEKWRVTRPSGTSWNSPLVWENAKRTEVVVCSKGLITSHDPESGAELWRAAGVDVPAASSFAADSERLYFGLRGPKRRGPLYALRAGAEGDQSPAAGATEIRCQAWAAGAPPGLSSPVAGAGLVFTLNASILACHDAETGEFLYRERLEGLSTVAASPLLVGETLLVLDEEGSALLLRAGRTFEIVGRARLDDHFWATPALAGGVLLLRGVERLYCVR